MPVVGIGGTRDRRSLPDRVNLAPSSLNTVQCLQVISDDNDDDDDDDNNDDRNEDDCYDYNDRYQ